jgi:cell division FtsZ-interacting protein ZapD
MVMERQRTKAKTQTAIPAFERDALNSVISGVEQQLKNNIINYNLEESYG